MDHFLDIGLRPDPELSSNHLMDVLFGKLHLVLVARQAGDVGISFPGVAVRRNSGLGDIMRLHGNEAALDALMGTRWLAGSMDYVHRGSIAAVPAGIGHCVVRRVQAKSSADRIRRRQMRRHGYDEVQARERVPANIERTLALPYVNLRSASTGHAFRLFIEHGPMLVAPQEGRFSAYGLSLQATVPWF